MSVEVNVIEFSPEGEAKYKQALIVNGSVVKTIWVDGIHGKTNHMELRDFWRTVNSYLQLAV